MDSRKLSFILASQPDTYEQKEIEQLNEQLIKIGVKITFDTIESRNKKKFSSITFNYDTMDIKKHLRRNAGRKQMTVDQKVMIADVKKKMETMTAEQVAAELGISRATLFRRLKQAEKWGDDHFW